MIQDPWTFGAAAVAAAAATMGVFMQWRDWRGRARYDEPFAELRRPYSWREGTCTLPLVVRNPLPEAIEVEAIHLLRPRVGRLESLGQSSAVWEPAKGRWRSEAGRLIVNRGVNAAGSTRAYAGSLPIPGTSDAESWKLVITLPDGWSGGTIALSIAWRTTSGNRRLSHRAVSMSMTADEVRQIAENTKSKETMRASLKTARPPGTSDDRQTTGS